MKRSLIISLHDVHPHSLPKIQEQRQLLQEIGIKTCSLLVIPHYHHRTPCDHHPQCIQYLQARQATDEIVLHGYYHDRRGLPPNLRNFFWTHLYTQNEAEFCDLNETLAEKRLNQGLMLLQKIGLSTHGFIAPGWLLHPRCIPILKRLGFLYTTTLRKIIRLNDPNSPILAHSHCWSARSLWRRSSSQAWNSLLLRHTLNHPILRVALHPQDFQFPQLKKQITRIIRQALQLGFQPTTYRDFLLGSTANIAPAHCSTSAPHQTPPATPSHLA
ncbi:MAG: polysaccharide deacetylase family protein [Methylacidiphilales bacterium]|nr:polysaccharide deacetylase family protein [Candidatus Methylacidiphilales bacterium]MDW8349865.1 polysaccharide deacetylase family protein [Verrucomicrobiae bacterium]